MRRIIDRLARLLREDYRGELEALVNIWHGQGQPMFLIQVKRLLSILDILKGQIQIRVENAMLFRNFVITIISLVIVIVIVMFQTNQHPSTLLEEKITNKDLTEVCKNTEVKSISELYHNFAKDNFVISLKLISDLKTDVYPVFRWKCQYEIGSNNKSNSSESSFRPNMVLVGLDLDKHCVHKYIGDPRELIKSGYHDYKDPSSWFCVNPNYH